MFGGDIGTPFDLQMHLFRIPVRVIPTFWLVMALLRWNPERMDLVFLWVMCGFFSILFHELGHALVAAAFGYSPQIVLNHFGGYAAFHQGRDWSPWKSLLITIAGPFPQLFLGLGFFVAMAAASIVLPGRLEPRVMEYVEYTLMFLVYINIAWPLLNLVPVLPLDGGQIVRSLLQAAELRDADGISLKISVAAAALTAAVMFQFQLQGGAIFFLFLTVMSLQQLQARRW